MATELRLRRGTTDEHGNFIGAEAEATVDTDKNTIVVHDGQTQGGFPLALEKDYTLYAESVEDLESLSLPAGVNVYLAETGREGAGTIKSGTAPSDTLKGRYIVLANGNYWSRNEVRFIDPAWYGADFTGVDPSDSEWDAAITEALASKLAILPRPGTYKKVASSAHDNFTGLYVFGRGRVTIDFQTDDAFKLGDFTQDVDGFYTQTSITCSDIVFSGVKFIPSDNGWDGSKFAYARPLAFSSAQNVHVTDQCEFHDNHVGAVDFAAPCKDIFIDHNHFESTEDASLSCGVRPFCYVAPLDNLNEDTGELEYAAPTVYHDNVNVTNCTSYNKGYFVLSWNVHNSNYKNNTIRKPLTRGISVTNWNFDCLISGNKYIVENNAAGNLSTCIRIGTGSERVTIENERFSGTLSGLDNNSFLKVIHPGTACRDIVIKNNTFNIVNAQDNIITDKNAEVTIDSNTFHEPTLVSACITVKGDNTGLGTYTGQNTLIINNKFIPFSRCVQALDGHRGEEITVQNNEFKTLLTDRMFAISSADSWFCKGRDNTFPLGGFNYAVNFGAGSVALIEFDRLTRSMKQINTFGANVTLDWRNYGGEFWYIVPDVTQTIDDITGEIANGQILTITVGGNVTFPNGPFKNNGGGDAALNTNDVISYINRAGFWFEISRSSL